ncbi:MAG: hypothetical protein IKW03_00620 [Clostridia bacterium]|nr:hypothetical protein [Clostridia bacterium]
MKKTGKIISIILSICILLGTISVISFATDSKTYYIDSINGDDANSASSPDDAVKTINGLKLDTINPGDTFLFRNGGTYNDPIVINNWQGTKENPIVISSYGDGKKAILRTDLATEVITLIDCSYITVSDLEITAPNGGGIWINTANKTSEGITLDNIYFHDMPNGKVNGRSDCQSGAAVARAAVMVKSFPKASRFPVNNLTISNCEVDNIANGFIIWGSWNEQGNAWVENENDIDPVFNEGLLITDCYLHNMDAEAILIGICDDALVTNCRMIDTCQGEGLDENGEIQFFTAACWFWGSVNSTVQYCEIAGQKNVGDGMTVDFDSYSHNCTYQYIYSHDNMRFVCNNPNYSGHHGNTVRYCLSINDNGGRSTTAVGSAGEHKLNFYNNTIINSAEFHLKNMYNAIVANNIFVMNSYEIIAYDADSLFRGNKITNNCFYNVLTPLVATNTINTNPGFAGTDTEDILSYVLSKDSPLIGAGIEIEGAPATDFFGNEITSNNIGCYGGNGVDVPYEAETSLNRIIRFIRNIFETLVHEIMNLFD